MGLYLTISEGPRADRAIPVMATNDQRIIALVAEELSKKLTQGRHPEAPKLRSLDGKRRPAGTT